MEALLAATIVPVFALLNPTDTIDRNYETCAIMPTEVGCLSVRDSCGEIYETAS